MSRQGFALLELNQGHHVEAFDEGAVLADRASYLIAGTVVVGAAVRSGGILFPQVEIVQYL